MLIFFGSGGLHALVNPLAAHGGVDVIDLDADGAGVHGAGFAGVIPFPFEFGGEARAEESEGVEVAFEISVLAVVGEDAVALGVGGGGLDNGGGASVRILGFRGHRKQLLE